MAPATSRNVRQPGPPRGCGPTAVGWPSVRHVIGTEAADAGGLGIAAVRGRLAGLVDLRAGAARVGAGVVALAVVVAEAGAAVEAGRAAVARLLARRERPLAAHVVVAEVLPGQPE